MAGNPYYIEPANALQALMSGAKGYEVGQQGRRDAAIEAAAPDLAGGNYQAALAKIMGGGGGNWQTAMGVAQLQNSQRDYGLRERAQGSTETHQRSTEDIARQELAIKQASETRQANEPKALSPGQTLVVPRGPEAGKIVYGNEGGKLDEPTVDAMARQLMAGDTSVLTNLGRGAQGPENVIAVRKRVAELNRDSGESGAEQANRNAEFFGVKSGQRTLGNKQANIELAATEFKQVLPIVQDASNSVNRTNYPDLNKIIQMAQEKTGDPNIVKFGSGVNTLVNLYARAISPTGAPTVSDKDHARVLLNRAWSQGQFNAAVDMMTQEIDAALKSPEKVREDMRRRFLGGVKPQEAPAPAAAPTNAPGGVVDWQTYFGGK